jgi:DNA-binding NarL/FixJ family response regulator
VADGRSLVETALRLKPGLILLDISMPLLSGIEAARRIKASLPEVKILFFTMHHERPYLQAAFEAGAAGYLLKSATNEELLRAVQEIQNGHLYFPKELSEHGRFLRDPDQAAKSLRLSSREQEILHLIAEGRSSKEMANILNISVKTISFHRENIKQKLGVKTIAELTRHAIANGVV